eukprot:TRINITY_DN4172_c0_g4_i1.p1 TRINITY_DN4172_c0_g4~~TRINITY_DN4172_c0_g4_i1.p1  ORF type:complete len:390 (+),score=48.12 TRINITY_DN4172_c0_g4_i1:63-1232(+)
MAIPQVEGYILFDELGSGASASVFAARKRSAAVVNDVLEDCAVKVYGGERATQQFLKELQMLKRVSGHPNVAQLLASCDGVPSAIVMPLYRGRNLDSLVRRRKGLPELAAALILKDVIVATQHVHHCGVLHRDIKPENILLSNGRVVLIDFDVACQISEVDDPRLLGAGTAGYMSPEMALRLPIGTPTDLFSIGCTLYFMFRKKAPFRSTPHSETAVILKTTQCKFQFDALFDDVSEACKNMISSLLVREPAERLSSEQALQHEWLTSKVASYHASGGSGMSSNDEPPSASSNPDSTVARARAFHQPSVLEAEPSDQDSQQQAQNSSDAHQSGTPQASSSRRYASRKPEPRRPIGNPVGHTRSTFQRQTAVSFAHRNIEPDGNGSTVEE